VAMFTTANPEVEINNRDKIKYLKRYITLDREIDRKLKEVDCWRAKLSRLTPVYSSQPKGGGTIYSRTEEIIIKITDMEEAINADIDKLIDLKQEIERVIDSVPNDKERILLKYRYLDGKTFEWIAAEMHYSWRQIHRLHSRALTNLKMS
jgi:DNA-directed RNA polymerase specialized sigma24 family protein